MFKSHSVFLLLGVALQFCTQMTSANDSVNLSRCLAEIDTASAPFSRGDVELAERQLNQLLHSCAGAPQLHHNLGVLDAEQQNWSAAIAHFDQSLNLDQRAAMTQQSLASIYQFKAGRAYQKALKLARQPSVPQFAMQNSSLTNVCLPGPAPTSVTNVAQDVEALSDSTPAVPSAAARSEEVRYDVRSWWTAAREQDPEAYQAFYRNGYQPPVALNQRSWPEFDNVNVDIEWADTIALVTLQIPGARADIEASDSITVAAQEWLLVMQRSENFWKIVREQIVNPVPADDKTQGVTSPMTDASQ